MDERGRRTAANQASAASDLVGLVPAAGYGTRLLNLAEPAATPGARSTSKEALSLGVFRDHNGVRRPRPLASHVLERLRAGGVTEAVIVLRTGKQDVRAALGDGSAWGVAVRYVETPPTRGVPHTLLAACDEIDDRPVVLVFPDILFEPKNALRALRDRFENTRADLVLGLFPSDRPEKTDMVELDDEGRPRDLAIKEADCPWRYTWSIALWSPAFGRFLAEFVARFERETCNEPARELWFGEVVKAALDSPLRVECEIFEDGRYLDVGTPEDFERAQAELER